jgi:hypothetical protein
VSDHFLNRVIRVMPRGSPTRFYAADYQDVVCPECKAYTASGSVKAVNLKLKLHSKQAHRGSPASYVRLKLPPMSNTNLSKSFLGSGRVEAPWVFSATGTPPPSDDVMVVVMEK